MATSDLREGRQSAKLLAAIEFVSCFADRPTPLVSEFSWLRLHGDALPDPIDKLLFDYAVDAGVGKAIRDAYRAMILMSSRALPRKLIDASSKITPEFIQKLETLDKPVYLMRLTEMRIGEAIGRSGNKASRRRSIFRARDCLNQCAKIVNVTYDNIDSAVEAALNKVR